jgi:multiple sugar transport system permease protein
VAALLSFTYFDTIQFPKFIGLRNYITLLTQDDIFMKYVLPNTIEFAVIVGPGGYMLSFLLAWMLAQLPRISRTILALILYSPSMTTAVTMAVVWRTLFSGDQNGYLNSFLLNMGLIQAPIQWLQSPQYLMPIMIVVTLWSSMGVGFLAMLAGILEINPELYEAAAIDGMSSRWQEIFFITIPSMKPQMLFGAVMAIVGTFQAGAIGVTLSGANPTPQYAGQLIVNHIEDYGFLRYEMGYAAAVSVVLLLMVLLFSRLANRLFSSEE